MLNCLSPYIQCGLNKKGHSWTANDEEIEAAATAPQTQSASVLPTGSTYNHTGWLSLSLSLCVCRRERIKGESICTSLLWYHVKARLIHSAWTTPPQAIVVAIISHCDSIDKWGWMGRGGGGGIGKSTFEIPEWEQKFITVWTLIEISFLLLLLLHTLLLSIVIACLSYRHHTLSLYRWRSGYIQNQMVGHRYFAIHWQPTQLGSSIRQTAAAATPPPSRWSAIEWWKSFSCSGCLIEWKCNPQHSTEERKGWLARPLPGYVPPGNWPISCFFVGVGNSYTRFKCRLSAARFWKIKHSQRLQ